MANNRKSLGKNIQSARYNNTRAKRDPREKKVDYKFCATKVKQVLHRINEITLNLCGYQFYYEDYVNYCEQIFNELQYKVTYSLKNELIKIYNNLRLFLNDSFRSFETILFIMPEKRQELKDQQRILVNLPLSSIKLA